MFSLKASATPDQDVHRLSPGAGGLATSMVRGCRWLARLGRSGDINGPRMWLAGPAREGRRHQWSADVVGGPGAGGAATSMVRGCGWRARRGRAGDARAANDPVILRAHAPPAVHRPASRSPRIRRTVTP